MKNIRTVLSENFQFLVVKFALYLNRHVFVMKLLVKLLHPIGKVNSLALFLL